MQFNTLFIRFKHRFANHQDRGLLANIGWLTIGMMTNRVLRLLITIVVARTLSQADYGLIALIFTAHEMIGLFLQRCTNVKLIQAPRAALDPLCDATYSLNWLLGSSLFLIQCATGWLLSQAYQAPELFLPLCALALTYLQLPFAMVQAALNFRDGKLRLVAKIDVGQTLVDTGGVLALIAAGAGIWALVIPKILTPLIWILGHRNACPWRSETGWSTRGWSAIMSYSGNLLLIDGMQVLRQNADYLLIGYFLGVEALGLYFFAFNAGLGIATSFSMAISNALLPHLCESADQRHVLRARYQRGLKLTLLLIGGLMVLQTSLANIYVPVVFGQDWVDRGSVELIVLLCLVALPKSLIDVSSQYLRAENVPATDLKLQTAFSVMLMLAFGLAVMFGLKAVAIATVVSYYFFAGLMISYCLRLSDDKTSPFLHQRAQLPAQTGA